MISTPSSASVGGVGIWGGSLNVSTNPEIILYQNFIDAPSLASWLTLSRLSTATYFDSSMLLKDAAQDTARFDNYYDAASSSVKKRGLLLEKQSTNYITNSITTHNGTLANGASSSKTAIYNPLSNLNTGCALNRIAESGWVLLASGITFNATQVTISQYFNFGTDTSSTFRLDGAKNSSKAVVYEIRKSKTETYQNCGTFMRAVFTLPSISSFSGNCYIGQYENAGVIASEVVKLYGWQLEPLLYATSFIKTTTAAVTRAADNIQLNLSNYTGSVKLIYERQDTNVIETKWLELTNQTNPVLSSNLDVGIWLQSIAIYNRILTAQEKTNA